MKSSNILVFTMWHLHPDRCESTQQGRKFCVVGCGSFKVGRPLKTAGEAADIIIPGDPSISKIHCQVDIAPQSGACTITGLTGSQGLIAGRNLTSCTMFLCMSLHTTPKHAHDRSGTLWHCSSVLMPTRIAQGQTSHALWYAASMILNTSGWHAVDSSCLPSLHADQSTFGTVVDGQKLSKGQTAEIPISGTTKIKFGYKTDYSLVHVPLIVAPSPSAMQPPQALSDQLAARWVPQWTAEATHVLVHSGSPVDSSVACAMLRRTPIVDLSW